jgi:hypothetical protein
MLPLPWRATHLTARRRDTLRRCVWRLAAVFGLVSLGSVVDSSTAVLIAADVQKGADRENAVAAKPAGSADAAFRAVLPDGAVIELVGLCEHPSAGHDWWRPDGSPLGKTPSGEAPKDLTSPRAFNVRLGNPHALDRDIAIDARLPEGGEVELSWQNLKAYGSASTFQKSGDKKVLQSLRSVAQFEPNSRTTLVVHYAPEPWQTYCEFKNWYTRRGKRVRSGSGMVSHGSRTLGVIMARPSEENGTSTLVATYDLDDVEHRDVRIVAVDPAGLELPAGHRSGITAHNAHMLMVRFEHTPLEKIETFLFQSRKFQSVGFRNVSLHRGQKTNFAVHIGDEPWEPTGPHSPRRKRRAAKKSSPPSKEKAALPRTPQ